MAKLGKKARKFAKKNLQSVLKRKRKLKSMFKKKASKRGQQDANEEHEDEKLVPSNDRKPEVQDMESPSLDAILGEDCSDMDEDDSDSDGYLSEVSSDVLDAHSPDRTFIEDGEVSDLSMQNKEILSELVGKKKTLDKLKKKDPGFCDFLEKNDKHINRFNDEEMYSDDEEAGHDGTQTVEAERLNFSKLKWLTVSTINSWHKEAIEQHSLTALTSLLNGYRAACHCGRDSTSDPDGSTVYKIQSSETYSSILVFMLREADKLFSSLLGISKTNRRKEIVSDMKKTSKWKTLKPLLKSYLRSTLFLLNQVTDSKILDFSLMHLRASIIFFAAFPPLLHRLVKISVHLWATGEASLSSHAFLVVRDVSALCGPEWFDICLIRTCRTFIGHCKFVEPGILHHLQTLRSNIVDLCSMDLQKSSSKALISTQKLAKILQLALQTKKKEAVKKICSWQFANCIDLWVEFVSANIRDYDLQPLLFLIIQIVNGVARLFLGPRYLPFRIKCIQWLNYLSRSSGIFIPVASTALDILEYEVGKVDRKPGKDFNFSSSIKLPKYWLKSQDFHEHCVLSVVELLCMHLDQWSYHISFPELATMPLIRLRKFNETTTNERFRHVVKHFIDQVEQNIDFVRKKRDELPFSPNDQQSVDSFLQLEKCSSNTAFKQYYSSIIQKAVSRNIFASKKFSSLERKNSTRWLVNGTEVANVEGQEDGGKDGHMGKKRKKRKS